MSSIATKLRRSERFYHKRRNAGDDHGKRIFAHVNSYERRRFGRRLLAKLDKRKVLAKMGEVRPL